MTEFLVVPPLIVGLVIGLYEIILLHRDVTVPMHRFGHGIHALVYAVIACFVTMNAEWVLANFTFLEGIPLMSALTLQILVGVITMIKIHGVSAAIKTTGMGISVGMRETWFHSLLIGALVVAAPYVWPLIAPVLPAWMQ
ncbi:MAG: hypothetical protein QXT19_01725 [Candidatus Woesearchaeota archaeon]